MTEVALVNIRAFELRLSCDRVAKGVVEAVSQVGVNVPVVVRLEGTNADDATALLQESNLDFIVAKDLKDAAQKVVAASRPRV